MTEIFLAKVDSIDDDKKIIVASPLITNVDGQSHIQIDARLKSGEVVEAGDIVVLSPMKNELTGEEISDIGYLSRSQIIETIQSVQNTALSTTEIL